MISSIGNNNLDVLMQSYRTLEERPIRRLESRRETIDNRLSLFNDLKSQLRQLESLAKELSYSGTTSIFGQKSATVSDDSYLTVSAASTAAVTSHTITVNQLAKSDKIVSNQYNLTGTDIESALGAGTYSFDVTVNGSAHQVSVDIAAGDDNEAILNKIVTAVNNTTDIGISASVIQDTANTGRLVFISQETGAAYEMSLTDVSGTLLSTIGMNDSVQMSGTSGGYVYNSTELNAKIVIDQVSVERNSNSIKDAVSGLTIQLKKTHTAGQSPVTVNVENDHESIKSKIQDFIDAYNTVMDFIQKNTGVNTTTYERSALSGDFAVTHLKTQLRNILSDPVSGLSQGDPTILSEIGITTDRGGKLSISDSTQLDNYLQGNLDQVAALFNSADGFAQRLEVALSDFTAGDGVIERRKDVLQGQVNLINRRIDRLEKSVDRKMEYYRQQFSRLQAQQSMFASQSAFINQFLQNGFFY